MACLDLMPHSILVTTIDAVHVFIFSTDPETDRAFLRDVLGYPKVDDGGGWLIFKLPPGEIAVHPADGSRKSELYLMCDDLESTVETPKEPRGPN